jgi:hypothetical protein
MSEHDSFRSLEVGQLHGEDLVGDSQERVEGGLDRVTPPDGDVTVEDLLEGLDVGNEAFSFGEASFQYLLRVPLVGVGRPHQVHRDVRIEKNHRGGESR